MCMMFCLHVYVCTMCMASAGRANEGVEYAVTEVTDSYEPLSAGCWELMNMVLCQSSSALNHRPVSPVHPSLEAMV